MRITGFLTNTGHGGPGAQLADLELRHRRHGRVEDRIRAVKDTGMRNLPYHDFIQNRVWLAIAVLAADLLAWPARLALPTSAATYEPERLRLWLLAVAGRIVRNARRRVVQIDPAWPWSDLITTAQARLRALPVPDPDNPHADQDPGRRPDSGPGATPAQDRSTYGADHQTRQNITVQPLRKIEDKLV